MADRGGIPEWPKGPDCKSGDVSLRRFESCFPQFLTAGLLHGVGSVAGLVSGCLSKMVIWALVRRNAGVVQW